MKKEKTNIDHLRKILKDLKYVDSEKGTEAIEFLDAIEEEIKEKDQEISDIESGVEMEDEDDDKEAEYDNSDFVGLDTINWSLDNGNIAIQQQVESFIERLQRENAVVPA